MHVCLHANIVTCIQPICMFAFTHIYINTYRLVDVYAGTNTCMCIHTDIHNDRQDAYMHMYVQPCMPNNADMFVYKYAGLH